MASSDDFKEQLKAGKIVEALALALGKAAELEITTWVSLSEDSDAKVSSSGGERSLPGHRLRTRINMVGGDIENEVGNKFIGGGPYRELRQFHQQQVQDSHKFIENNLKSLQKLFGILVKLRQTNPDAEDFEPALLPGGEPEFLPPDENSGANQAIEAEVYDIEPPFPDETSAIADRNAQAYSNDEFDFDAIAPTDAPTNQAQPDNFPWTPATLGTTIVVGGTAAIAGSLAERENLHPADLETESNSADSILDELEPFSEAPASPDAVTDLFSDENADSVLDQLEDFPQESRGNLASEQDDFTSYNDLEASTASPEDTANLDADLEWSEESLLNQLESFPEEPRTNPPHQDTDELVSENGSVLDQLEPFPEESPANSDEDWGDLLIDEPPPLSAAISLEAIGLGIDENWVDLGDAEDEPTAAPSLESLDLGTDENWPNLASEHLSASAAPSLESLDLGTDESWGGVVDAEDSPTAAPSLESLDLGTDENWADLVEQPASASPELNLESLDLGTDENWTNFAQEQASASPAPSLESLDLGTDENWGDLVDEEAIPTAAPSLESLDLGTDENWVDLGDLESSPPASSLDSLALDTNEDWGDLVDQDLEPPTAATPSLESLDLGAEDEWGDLLEPEASPSPQATPSLGTEDEWGDLLEPEASPEATPSLASLGVGTEDEWGDLVEPEPPQQTGIPSLGSLDLDTDEGWEELVVEEADPFGVPLMQNGMAGDLAIENWEEFSLEELEPYPGTSEVMSGGANSSQTNNEFDQFDIFADITAVEVEAGRDRTSGLTPNLEDDQFEETIVFEDNSDWLDTPDAIASLSDVSGDAIDDLFAEPSPPQTKPPSPSPSIEDSLFDQLPDGDLSLDLSEGSSDNSDLLAAFDDDDPFAGLLPSQPSVSPPPPPSKPSTQSNRE